jgi:hypothetical protein
VGHQAHNLKVIGSNPIPQPRFINRIKELARLWRAFHSLQVFAVQKETVIYQSVSAIPRKIPNGSHKLHGTKPAQSGTKIPAQNTVISSRNSNCFGRSP